MEISWTRIFLVNLMNLVCVRPGTSQENPPNPTGNVLEEYIRNEVTKQIQAANIDDVIRKEVSRQIQAANTDDLKQLQNVVISLSMELLTVKQGTFHCYLTILEQMHNIINKYIIILHIVPPFGNLMTISILLYI